MRFALHQSSMDYESQADQELAKLQTLHETVERLREQLKTIHMEGSVESAEATVGDSDR